MNGVERANKRLKNPPLGSWMVISIMSFSIIALLGVLLYGLGYTIVTKIGWWALFVIPILSIAMLTVRFFYRKFPAFERFVDELF